MQEDNDENVDNNSGWDIDMLRSNMFAFIDGNGNIVYEKLEEADAGYEADTNRIENISNEEKRRNLIMR